MLEDRLHLGTKGRCSRSEVKQIQRKTSSPLVFRSICTIFVARNNNIEIMSIDTYKLTSTEEPTDEVLSQLMREAAEEARETNAEATQRYFEELRRAAANIR